MEIKVLIFVLLSILVCYSNQSPVNSRFKDLSNHFISYDDLNGAEDDKSHAIVKPLVIKNWRIPQTSGWEFWTRIYDEFTTQEFNDFQTDDYFTQELGQEFTDNYFTQDLGQELTETSGQVTDEQNEYSTNEYNFKTTTNVFDLEHPCGPLIVNLNKEYYFLNEEKLSTIKCNAYFSKHFRSRCYDGSIFEAEFELKINGKSVINEYMKRISMSYNGFDSKFMISGSSLKNLSFTFEDRFSAICEVTIKTESGSATNQSFESIVYLNNGYIDSQTIEPTEDHTLNTGEPTKHIDNNNTQFITETVESELTSIGSSESCGPLNVNLSKNKEGEGNTYFQCWAQFFKPCDKSSIVYTEYELIIDERDIQEKYLTKSSIWFPEYYTEFAVKNSILENLSKKYDNLNTHCKVTVFREMDSISNTSSTLLSNIKTKKANGSPLNASCSYPQECIPDRNLTCDWDLKCKCKYDDYLQAYYVPYQRSNEWYCARPAKHYEHCFHDKQCKQLDKRSLCTQTEIGKVCECDKIYYWNGFKCVSIKSESTTSYYEFTYSLNTNYTFEKIIVVSLGGILGAYLLIIFALHLFIKNKKKQVKRAESVHKLFQKKKFVPKLFLSAKSEDKKEIIKDDKITKLKVVE